MIYFMWHHELKGLYLSIQFLLSNCFKLRLDNNRAWHKKNIIYEIRKFWIHNKVFHKFIDFFFFFLILFQRFFFFFSFFFKNVIFISNPSIRHLKIGKLFLYFQFLHGFVLTIQSRKDTFSDFSSGSSTVFLTFDRIYAEVNKW